MTTQLKYILLLLAFIGGCSPRAQVNDRMQCINEFVSAIKNGDSAKLYSLVDTAAFFRVQNHGRFMYILQFVNDKGKECPIRVVNSTIDIKDVPGNSKVYSVPLCRSENGQVIDGISFDLQLTFREYEDKNTISDIAIKNYSGVPAATKPPGE